MSRNDWSIITSILFLSFIVRVFSALYISNKFLIPKVKTVSMMQIMGDGNDENYIKFLNGELAQDDYSKLLEIRMKKIQDALNHYSNDRDILLVEEAVIKSNKNNFISITEAIKNYVK